MSLAKRSGCRMARVWAICVPIASILIQTAGAAAPFDGTYVGVEHAIHPENCGFIDRPARFKVMDNSFSIRLGHETPKSVIVASDGTFSASGLAGSGEQTWAATLSGKIASDQLEAEIGSSHCAVHFSATKRLIPVDGTFDGTYVGVEHAIHPENCGFTDRPYSIKVMDNSFSIRLGQEVSKSIIVASDGTFSSSGLAGYLGQKIWVSTFSGKIAGDQFEAEIGSPHCAVHLSANKKQPK